MAIIQSISSAFWPIQRSMLGTNCTPMVPKLSALTSMMFELFNAVSHVCSRRFVRFAQYFEIWEYQFACKNCSKSSNFQTFYKDLEAIRIGVIQDLKTQNTYFSSRKNLGTIGVPFVPKKYNFDSNTKFTKIWPTQPTNEILQKIVVPKWYPKFYIQTVQGLSFSTPCQPSP